MAFCHIDSVARSLWGRSAHRWSPFGAELVGVGATSLLGNRPWEVLLWLYEPVFEDRYRAAVVTRQPTSFTATRPPTRHPAVLPALSR